MRPGTYIIGTDANSGARTLVDVIRIVAILAADAPGEGGTKVLLMGGHRVHLREPLADFEAAVRRALYPAAFCYLARPVAEHERA